MKFLSLCILLGVISLAWPQDSDRYVLVIHGGAGNITRKGMTSEREKAYREKLTEALTAGHKVLEKGGSSLDAVQTAIEILEDSPLFNAGKGAVFTSEGKNELDASIMDGKTLNAGAVGVVTIIKNPIAAARKVMEDTPHVLLVGKGAEEFAKEAGLEIVEPGYFYVERRWKQMQRAKKKREKKDNFHTVGAVALDQCGNLAAGTSTGGLTAKRYGRVGDSPIIGAGTYANNDTCAISSTGYGEYFMRSLAAYDISAMMEYKNLTIEQAAREVIMNKLIKLGGQGGVIGVDRKGNVVMIFNTNGMFRGCIKSDGKAQVFMYK